MSTPAEVRRQRARAQGLAVPTDRTPAKAVRRLRSSATTEEQVRAAYDAGTFVRTHVLRPTWHFVATEDVRWLLATTAPRVHQVAQGARRRFGLDAAVLARSLRAFTDALADGVPRTRAELVQILVAAGVPTAGEAPTHVVMHAELEQVLVSGPMRGRQHTYVLMDDRVPRGRHDGADPVRLVERFLAGHGPAGGRDVARWSSLTLTTVRTALAELGDVLESVEVAGETYHRLRATDKHPGTLPPVLLLPLYDELPIAYRDLAHPGPPDHPHPPGTDRFVGCVFAGDENVGTWRRELQGARSVEVALDLAPSTPAAVRALAKEQAGRLATFLGRDLTLLAPGRG